MMRDRQLFKRYELKRGKPVPAGFYAAQDTDPVTGDTPGWLPVGIGKEDRWHREAYTGLIEAYPYQNLDGTYELLGPKIQGNPEHHAYHVLMGHGCIVLDNVPRTYEGLKAYLASQDIEGIVWRHDDGRMVKIKGRDFGFKRRKE
jgi:hypothetical protein